MHAHNYLQDIISFEFFFQQRTLGYNYFDAIDINLLGTVRVYH